MLVIDELHDVFCDALVDDDGWLVFASCWGRDTAIQELLARLTLPSSEGGLSSLTFLDDAMNRTVGIGNPDRLDKMTGRMPKANLFGDIVHLWLFDKKAVTPHFVNRRAYLLLLPDQDDCAATWALIKSVCPLPLLDYWQDAVANVCRRNGWLKGIKGYRINAVSIDLPDEEFGAQLGDMIRQGLLELDSDDNWTMAKAYRHPDF
ncbi:MAG: hypothetical protein CVV06_01910 [Gammaproteobacteria bacterium HGW-Gammaproteobacteria-10]|nr:MAG: hypothetical protein CVV06_01910 [Gammaproteobacteria bacterium HGW-Gammaproteobacteria-10]